jgi:hypothetical protein
LASGGTALTGMKSTVAAVRCRLGFSAQSSPSAEHKRWFFDAGQKK